MQVAILGAGSWGTALAKLLSAAAVREIRLWGREAALVSDLTATLENRRYLPGIPLPPIVHPTADLEEATRGARFVIFAVPCGAMREVAQEVAPYLSAEALFISAAKGLEEGADLRMSQVLAEALPDAEARTVVLSGPNLAVEVARGIPTASVAASSNPEAAQSVQRLFATLNPPTFRVYTGRDVIGVEMGGAIKNVIAIAAGVSDGMGFGDNSKAALMTRGLAETIRLGVRLGAEPSTFLGLSGVGDLIATGGSRLSRNYRLGVGLGQGRELNAVLAEIGQVAEGAPTTRAVCALAATHGVEMPVCEALRSVLFAGRPAAEVIRELMIRPPKEEI